MTTTDRQPTAADRLPAHLAGRLADFRAILDRDDRDEGDDELPPLDEYGLHLSIRRVYAVRFELSTGGPADYITATVEDDELTDVRYHFADWFDHADRELTGDELDTVRDYLAALFDPSDADAYATDR